MTELKFDLIKDHYIRKIDDRNWGLCRTITVKEGKNEGQESEKIEGFFGTLQAAWNGATVKLPLKAENHAELLSIINRLEKLKTT